MATFRNYQNGVEKTCRDGFDIYFCRSNRGEILVRLIDFINYFSTLGWNYESIYRK